MISVITPLFGDASEQHDTERERLAATISSLGEQTAEVEHVLVGEPAHIDGPAARSPITTRTVPIAAGDDWLSAGIAAAADRFIVLFAGDRCEPAAVERLQNALMAAGGRAAMVYADHRLVPTEPPSWDAAQPDASLVAIADHRADVVLKPAPSPMYLRSKNYVANAALFDSQQFDSEQSGDEPFAHDPVDAIHDLVLRASELGAVQIAEVLFDLRGPTAIPSASVAAAERAVQRAGVSATVVAGSADTVRVRYHATGQPLVSVIIPTRGSVGREWGVTRSYVVDAVTSMAQHSGYQHLEFIVVYDVGTPVAALDALERVAGQRTRFVEYPKPFNFSDKINVGVAASAGELLLLLNDDTELIDPATVEELVGLAQQPGIGVVGARLLYSDGTLQHGGHVYSGEMLHACEGWPGDSPGPRPLTPLAVTRETTGVTAAAAMVRREIFDEVGGFSPEFPVNFNDVDFCLKVVAAGYRNLWTPNALWYHFESVSRGRSYDDAEVDRIFARWNHELHHDPYYNPNLIPKRADWLEAPQLSEW